MGEAPEAECGALYNNTKIVITLLTTLEEMDCPQVITPITTANYTAHGIINIITQKNHTPCI